MNISLLSGSKSQDCGKTKLHTFHTLDFHDETTLYLRITQRSCQSTRYLPYAYTRIYSSNYRHFKHVDLLAGYTDQLSHSLVINKFQYYVPSCYMIFPLSYCTCTKNSLTTKPSSHLDFWLSHLDHTLQIKTLWSFVSGFIGSYIDCNRPNILETEPEVDNLLNELTILSSNKVV